MKLIKVGYQNALPPFKKNELGISMLGELLSDVFIKKGVAKQVSIIILQITLPNIIIITLKLMMMKTRQNSPKYSDNGMKSFKINLQQKKK